MGKCACCGKPGKTSKCGRCGSTGYCSQACQKKHWREHKSNCELTREEKCSRVFPSLKDKCISQESEYFRFSTLAAASYDLGHWEHAKNYLLDALNHTSDDAETHMALVNLADTYGKLLDFHNALNIIVRLRSSNRCSKQADTFLCLAKLYSNIRKTDKVVENCKKAWAALSDQSDDVEHDKLTILNLMCTAIIHGTQTDHAKKGIRDWINVQKTQLGLQYPELERNIELAGVTYQSSTTELQGICKGLRTCAHNKLRYTNVARAEKYLQLASLEYQLQRYSECLRHAERAIHMLAPLGALVEVAEAFGLKGQAAEKLDQSDIAKKCAAESAKKWTDVLEKWNAPSPTIPRENKNGD